MISACRFDATKIDVPLDTEGDTQSFHYLCADCHRWHWAFPEMEADGTEDSAQACIEAITAVLDRWYAKTAGITFSQAVADRETKANHKPWAPGR